MRSHDSTANPALAMAHYVRDAGNDGYTGVLFLYHTLTNQLIVQWTGENLDEDIKVQLERSLLSNIRAKTSKLNSADMIEDIHQKSPLLNTDKTTTNPQPTPVDTSLSSRQGSMTTTSYTDTSSNPPLMSTAVSQRLKLQSEVPSLSFSEPLALDFEVKAESGFEIDNLESDLPSQYLEQPPALSSNRSALTKVSVPVSSTVRLHRCRMCDYNAKSRGDLIRHNQCHTGLKRYSCSICDFTFSHLNSLKRHFLCRHTSEKPHQCPLCFRRFSRQDIFASHMKTHNQRGHMTPSSQMTTPHVSSVGDGALPPVFPNEPIMFPFNLNSPPQYNISAGDASPKSPRKHSEDTSDCCN